MRYFARGSNEIKLVGHLAVLLDETVYVTPEYTTTVPAGFLFDGASVPQWAWSVVGHPYMRDFRRPAAIHDFHCRYQPITSKLAHKIFYHGLRSENVAWWRSQLMFHAVDKFGPQFNGPDLTRTELDYVHYIYDLRQDPLYKLISADLRYNTPRCLSEIEDNYNMCYTENVSFNEAVFELITVAQTKDTTVARYLQTVI